MDLVSPMKSGKAPDISNGSTEAMNTSNSYKAIESTEKENVKRAAVCAEMDRLNQLPATAAKGFYATQRMRVLNKVLQLMSIQRTQTQDEELELLFAGLSL